MSVDIDRQLGAALTEAAVKSMYEVLDVVGQVATTEHMIQTGTSKKSKLPKVDAPVHPTKLTWRSGRLARSLTRGTDPEAIRSVEAEGTKIVGTIGSRVPYAAIHEFGGVINHPGGTAYIVTDAGAVFITNAAAARKKKPPKRTRPHEIRITERPFLRPAINDPITQEAMARIVSFHVAEILKQRRFRHVIRKN